MATHMRKRQPGESRAAYAAYVREYMTKQKQSSTPKYTQQTVSRAKIGMSDTAKTAAIATGKVPAPAGSIGLRVLQEVMAANRKRKR